MRHFGQTPAQLLKEPHPSRQLLVKVSVTASEQGLGNVYFSRVASLSVNCVVTTDPLKPLYILIFK